MRSQRIVYINASGQVQEVPKELLAEIALMQARSTQLPAQRTAENRPVKAATQPAQGALGSAVGQVNGPRLSRPLDAQVPRRLSENATAAGSQVHAPERSQLALRQAANNVAGQGQMPGPFVPVLSDGGPGGVARSGATKSQGRGGRTSALRQQAMQKSAGGEKTRPLPSSVQH